ncbi:MAG: hypothetical protein CO065_09095 [Comamonadaceae bacterium CG_4_9_14_0_8_um_filter_57_21]|nr:MAG: hypothetical protein CO065_09095 [Comamonadaceae bacterium CG_4_9_14_0_8_um_filter_57_21]
MVITLTSEQQAQLFEWVGRITEAHVNAEAMPPGYTLHIEVGAPFSPDAWVMCGSARLELGDVDIKLS